MKSQKFNSVKAFKTPLFYFDKNQIISSAKNYSKRNFILSYSVKACLFEGLVQTLDPFVDSFSVSSINELLDVKKETKKLVHFVSPLIRDIEISAINKYANSVSFNSLEQLDRFKDLLAPHILVYLRVNPEVSLIKDERYNPCRKFSKLGIPLQALSSYLKKNKSFSTLGLHFHNACQEKNGESLIRTLNKVRKSLGDSFSKFKYINIGGGYLFSRKNFNVWQNLQNQYEQKITIEPGYDLVNSSGYLISSVVDLFERNGKSIAVLDTSVNHIPESFEYGFSPDILDENIKNGHSYLLTGATCLAGDLFGEYSFKKNLKVGGFIIFRNVGAYSVVKLHRFNGIEIPNIIIDELGIKHIVQILNQYSKFQHSKTKYIESAPIVFS